MARNVAPALQAIIDSGHCRWYDAVDMTLRDGIPLYLSTGEVDLPVLGRVYHAQLEQVKPLTMTLNKEVDEVQFQMQNRDKVIGLTLTGETNMLNGAKGMLGIIFENEDTGERYYDPKMPGEVVSGEVDQESAHFNLVSELDSVMVAGRPVVSVFTWREPVHVMPASDPNDLNPGLGGGFNGDFGPGNPGDFRGRFPITDTYSGL